VVRVHERLTAELESCALPLAEFKQKLIALLALPIVCGKEAVFIWQAKSSEEVEAQAMAVSRDLEVGLPLREQHLALMRKALGLPIKGAYTHQLGQLYLKYSNISRLTG
jgi:hypothetical protein